MTNKESRIINEIKDNAVFMKVLSDEGAVILGSDNEVLDVNLAKLTRALFAMGMHDGWNDYDITDGEAPDDYRMIDQEGGGEGGGEYCESVFTIGGQYYKTAYNYYSYNGFDYDYISIKSVKPKKVEVVIYE